jgi:hypothetical protein
MMERIKEVREGDPISAETFNTLVREVMRLSNLTVDAPLELHQGPGGPCISTGEIASGLKWARITGTSSGGVNFGTGKYDGYLINTGALFDPSNEQDFARLGATNHVQLENFEVDGDQVIIWNATESRTDGALTHFLYQSGAIGSTYVSGIIIGEETFSGSNRRKVFLTTHLPTFGC